MKPRTSRLSAELLERPVRGHDLAGPTPAENLGPEPCLLVFLRHFG